MPHRPVQEPGEKLDHAARIEQSAQRRIVGGQVLIAAVGHAAASDRFQGRMLRIEDPESGETTDDRDPRAAWTWSLSRYSCK